MKTSKLNKVFLPLATALLILAVLCFIDFLALRILILLLTVVAIYVFFLMMKRHTQKLLKEQNEYYQLKLDMIRSSLDPHFLFNAMNTISFSMHKNDIDTATSNLSSISKFMRTSFGDFEKFGHELNEEIEFIKNYLTIEKFRFKNQFTYTIKVMPYVNDMNKVPCFSIFCFIENALKKGILAQEGNGTLTLNIDENQNDKTLVVKITENCIYNDLKNKKNFTHNIKVVNALVDKLNSINTQKIEINHSAYDNVNGEPQGCIVEMKIPLEYDYNLTPIQA